MKSYLHSQNQITVRVSRVTRVTVRAKVRYRLIIVIGQCQIWLLLQYYSGSDYTNKTSPLDGGTHEQKDTTWEI